MRVLTRVVAISVTLLFLITMSPVPGYSDAHLPREFDSLVPVYEPARPVDTRYTRQSATIRFTTPDAFERVVAFYAKVLGKSGWKISTSESGKKFIAAKARIILTLIEEADIGGFTINLGYPGGRE